MKAKKGKVEDDSIKGKKTKKLGGEVKGTRSKQSKLRGKRYRGREVSHGLRNLCKRGRRFPAYRVRNKKTFCYQNR